MSSTKLARNAWLVAAILLGAWLRFAHLGARGLWFDEGISLTYSQMSLSDVLHFHILWQDTNPPAYRILLGLWTALAGPTPFAARAFGSFLGLLAISLTYQLGRLLNLDYWPAIAASFLVAIFPMEVFYSRELKHYPLVQFFLLLVVWGWLRLFDVSSIGRHHPFTGKSLIGITAVLGIAAVLAVGSHYMAGLLLLVLDAATVVWAVALHRSRSGMAEGVSRLLAWFGAQFAAGLIVLPWLLVSGSDAVTGAYTTGAGQGSVTLRPLQFLASQFITFAAGPVGPDWQRIAIAIVLFSLVLIGIFQSHLRQPSRIFLGIWLLCPVLIGMIVQNIIPFFPPRFLLYVIPALVLLAGQGAVNLRYSLRRSRFGYAFAAPLLLIGLLGGFLLRAQFLEPQPDPDLRPLASVLRTQVQEGDALIYSYSWQPGMVTAYLEPGVQPTYYASFFPEGSLDASLEGILAKHHRVWLLTYEISADNPINDVGHWLVSHAATPGSEWYGESQLTLFLDPQLEASSAEPVSCVETLDKRLALCYHPIKDSGNPGQPLVIVLEWQIRMEVQERYVVFLHLIRPDNPIPAAQQDIEPGNGQSPTFSWHRGDTIRDPHAVILPSLPQNVDATYEIYAGLYDADTLDRVLLEGERDSIQLGEITVHAGR